MPCWEESIDKIIQDKTVLIFFQNLKAEQEDDNQMSRSELTREALESALKAEPRQKEI